MMSLVRMVLLLLSSWFVCHSFVSTVPAVSSATRLDDRRESSADRDLRDAVPVANNDFSRDSADFNSLPKSSDRERSLSTDGIRVQVRQTEGNTSTNELPFIQVGYIIFIDPRKLNRSNLYWDPARTRTLPPTESPFISDNITIYARIFGNNRHPARVIFRWPILNRNLSFWWDPARIRAPSDRPAIGEGEGEGEGED